jgi:hypothetical protein
MILGNKLPPFLTVRETDNDLTRVIFDLAYASCDNDSPYTFAFEEQRQQRGLPCGDVLLVEEHSAAHNT